MWNNAVDGNEKFTILGDELEYIYIFFYIETDSSITG